MNGFFIAVFEGGGQPQQMRKYEDQKQVLTSIASLSDGVELVRIFSVNSFGGVTHYKVVFDGRLRLERKHDDEIRRKMLTNPKEEELFQ